MSHSLVDYIGAPPHLVCLSHMPVEDFGDRSYNKCSTPTAEIGQWNDPVTCFTKTCLDDSPYLLMMICDDKNVNHVGKCVVPVLKWAGQNVRSVTIILSIYSEPHSKI